MIWSAPLPSRRHPPLIRGQVKVSGPGSAMLPLSVALLSAISDRCQLWHPGSRRQFGVRVRGLRERRGLSQEDLADAPDLHRTHISLIERGQRSVRLETIERLAVALRVQPGELMPEVKLPHA